jgi:ATP-dependent Clp protease ATP-binding subunit ClpA
MEGSAPSRAATATPPQHAPIDKAALLRQLKQRIVGQDSALEDIVDRLALTRMQFDLRPHRPDGVFLLAGPSGTGKTAFGRALAEHLFGDEGRLISLDMSEYAHDWALSRLIGPQPGYVGSDKPEGWLTTKVRRQPQAVIILDEIEKSHPTVWNTFLQAFDDGRLTDGQGNVADFSRTVILMTSNLGSESFQRKHPIGFLAGDSLVTELSDRTQEAVKQTMPPEFINRLDAIVVFNPLTPEMVREIAGREIQRALGRLRERGYETEVPPDVVAFIAEEGYDPAYGARHVHRSIERHLLETLVDQPPGKLRARVAGEAVEWVAGSTEGWAGAHVGCAQVRGIRDG